MLATGSAWTRASTCARCASPLSFLKKTSNLTLTTCKFAFAFSLFLFCFSLSLPLYSHSSLFFGGLSANGRRLARGSAGRGRSCDGRGSITITPCGRKKHVGRTRALATVRGSELRCALPPPPQAICTCSIAKYRALASPLGCPEKISLLQKCGPYRV